MAEEGFKRKLAAILSADVEGYSRLMGEDEEATVRTLTSYRKAITSLIQQFRGRVVDSPGDNVLAEFASIVDAVQCSVEIQRVLKAKNAELTENRRMDFRIGINLGDVIEEDDRIYGDGVNIAARVEGLAEAGGICISGSAFEQIENKLPIKYEYLGEHTVKNITKPIRVYRAKMETETRSTKIREERAGSFDAKGKSKMESNIGNLIPPILSTIGVLFILAKVFNILPRNLSLFLGIACLVIAGTVKKFVRSKR